MAFDFEVQILQHEKRLPFRYGSVCQHGADHDVNENEFYQLQSYSCSLSLALSLPLSLSLYLYLYLSIPGLIESQPSLPPSGALISHIHFISQMADAKS